ncbi:MAG: AraC family transcriptional regulator [Bacteroidota bacterium]
MKLKLEQINPDLDSSFRLLLTPQLNEVFYWHFHPEIELVYVEAEQGIRHIGDHVSTYHGADLALIGSNIPHLNFDYGAKTRVETVVIQFPPDYFRLSLGLVPEMQLVQNLMERAKSGLAFDGETKRLVGAQMKKIPSLPRFEQFVELLQIFQILAQSTEAISLQVRPIASQTVLKQQERMARIHQYVETHFQEKIDTDAMASEVSLTVPAFCRYIKKTTHLTYTDFVNRYRINYAKQLLIQHKNVTECCFEAGFESLSYFNRVFKRFEMVSPSQFKNSH